jgi:hypothetical protein
MTVANPDFLLVFNEASGTSVTNHGSQAGAYTINQGSSPTNWEWHPNTGPFTGFFESKSASGANMPYLSTAVAAPTQGLDTLNCAIGFQLHALGGAGATRLTSSSATTGDGDVIIMAVPPSGGGNFDLEVSFKTLGSQALSQTFTALSFNTNYQLAVSIDVSTPTAVQARFKLGAASVVAPATVNWSSEELDDEWPYLCRRQDFNNYFGLDGYLYYWAYERGGTAWSATDLADINTDPSAAINGWPGGGGPATTYVPPLPQRNRRYTGRYL